jgi:hypothetical protein
MKRLFLALVPMLVLVGCTGPAPTPTPKPSPSASHTVTPSASASPVTCVKPPPVYHPTRLAIKSTCVEAQGVVLAVLHETDGDYHIWLSLDPAYTRLLNSMNLYHGQPALVAEIVPACATEPASSSAAAQCPASTLKEPAVGDHISVRGPWVTDTIHGWNELHPIVPPIQELPKSTRHLTFPSPNASDLANGD